MHADELRRAVHRVVEVLNKADILAVVKEYRTARGDQRAVAAARLGHAGAVIMENMDKFSASEKAVSNAMFLDNLGSTKYWQALLGSAGDPQKNAAELVHLYSRVMFASTHLPNLIRLLGSAAPADNANPALLPIAGEARLTIRLTDAGERASDPDRIARSIDGVDMLYSACASIARKPAMDLRLDSVNGNEYRDVCFVGERESVAAVNAVIASIPDALAELGDDDDIDLDEVVASLPIFDDLNTLANLGTFTPTDLKDISETMHQGAMLVLESGVILVTEKQQPASTAQQDDSVQMRPGASNSAHRAGKTSNPPPILTRRAVGNGAAERDEHYERYLREREALQNKGASGTAQGEGVQSAEIDELLKNLGRSRDR